MNTMVHCFDKCGNPRTQLPEAPPPWGGGGTTPPVDPLAPYIFCPPIPATALAGSADAAVRITGQNIPAGVTVKMGADTITPTSVSATEISFLAPHAAQAAAGVETIQVMDGATAIPQTCQFTYTAAPLMVLVCPLSPISAQIGAAALTVRANGQNFTPTCVGTIDGTDLPTVYVSPTQLNLTINPVPETVRQAIIGVRDTATGYVSTVNCPFDFLQTVLTPTLTKISPDVTGYYDSTVTTYTGTNFDATSVISRGAVGEIPTTFVNSTTLTTAPDPNNATVAMFEIRVRNGTAPANYKFSNNMQASMLMNPGLNMLNITTAPISGGPITVELLGTNFGMEPTAMIAGTDTVVPSVKRSGGWLDVTLTPPGAPGTVTLDVRLGHAHADLPAGHDNIRPSALNTMYPGLTTLDFIWT